MQIQYIGMSRIIALLLLLWTGTLRAQNNALYFDGDNDFITVSPINTFAPNSNFTFEAWITVDQDPQPCSGNFRRLFALGGVGSRFEFGTCGGDFVLFWFGTGGSGSAGPTTISTGAVNIEDGQWHCVSVVRNGTVVEVFLDGVSLYTGAAPATLNSTIFRVGHWAGGYTPGQDWLGKVDEVRLWSTALPVTNLTACNRCVRQCNEPNLLVYWRLDQGTALGINTTITTAADCTPAGNNGVLSAPSLTPLPGFTLNNTSTGLSNFVTGAPALIYPQYTNLSMVLSAPTSPLSPAINTTCSGDPVHFALVDPSGNPVNASGNATIVWEYNDNWPSGTWNGIAPGPGALFNSFTFVSPPNTAALVSNNTSVGYVDRCFRAIITVTQGGSSCTYTVNSVPLRICTKITGALINVTPSGPLCAGDMVTLTASVSSNMPPPATGNQVHIQWMAIINGVMTNLTGPGFNDQPTITYPVSTPLTVTAGTVCFKATITNCACPAAVVQKCVTVDPKPVCGSIEGVLSPNSLMPDPDGIPDHYVICPNNDAVVKMVNPLAFMNCNPSWEYEYPNTQPGVWHPMGSSNAQQNTNVLPHTTPVVSPFVWPAGETCINYRIKCSPLNTPSGCQPCLTNILRVCLKTKPPAPVITASAAQICKGDIVNLTVSSPDPNCNYTWINNGLVVGFGSFLNSQDGGCFTVLCNDGCYTVASNEVCVEVCESVAIISCPDKLCPCVGDPITIDALQSYTTCGHPLTYTWTWINASGTLQTSTSSSITDVPAAAGTTYTLTVTDTVLGCSDTTQYTIVPCAP